MCVIQNSSSSDPQSSLPAAAPTLPHLGDDHEMKDKELLTAGQLSVGWSTEAMRCKIKTEV